SDLPFRTTHAAASMPFPSPPHTAVIQPLCHPRGSAVPPVSLWSNNGSFQWRFLSESMFPQTFPLFHSPSLEISKIPLIIAVPLNRINSRMDQQFHSIWNRQTAGIAGYGLSDMQIFPAKNENSPSKKQNGSNE